MTIPNQKHSAFQLFHLRLDPIRRSELDRTRILTESFHILFFSSFFWDHFGEACRKRKAARDLEEPFSR